MASSINNALFAINTRLTVLEMEYELAFCFIDIPDPDRCVADDNREFAAKFQQTIKTSRDERLKEAKKFAEAIRRCCDLRHLLEGKTLKEIDVRNEWLHAQAQELIRKIRQELDGPA